MMVEKYVYFFGGGKAEGSAKMKDLLGGKGANLAEMTNIGIPVPPGFTITTKVCDIYNKNNKRYPKEITNQIYLNLRKLEKLIGAKFGNSENPLLLSVRSGAAVSMPGMMDTVLNIGLNDEVVQGLIKKTNNPRFVLDSYRRFIQMFGNVVKGIEHSKFEDIMNFVKRNKNVKLDTELTEEDLKNIVQRYKDLYKQEIGRDFPTEPIQQLWEAIDAVFGSWNNERAKKYRKLNDIKGLLGTAVNVQAMVFGNTGNRSATGVAFTRNPSTGENKFYGEFLLNAQGEDVVAGIRTPQEISKESSQEWAKRINISEQERKEKYPSLEEIMPDVYHQLKNIRSILEQHYKDTQDIEFTIQDGTLYILQTRTGKRTAEASLRIAVSMVQEGLIDKETAIMRIQPNQLDHLLHPRFDIKVKNEMINKGNLLAKGLPASPGAAVGKVVFFADDAVEWKERNEDVILVRLETSPEDIGGMDAAKGILTVRGGMTSHAAVVARGMGKCCIAGCGELNIDYDNRQLRVGDKIIKEGDYISLDGSTGEVVAGKVKTIAPKLSGNFAILMQWADDIRKLGVKTNADTPKDAKVAREFGAEGIGLCRTEHMFFQGDRIDYVRAMILADDEQERIKPLQELKKMQIQDFKAILEAMEGLPVTIRLLDPPLHEFLPQPNDEKEISKIAKIFGKNPDDVKNKITQLHEVNPMLGHRGCRLGITFPDIYEMQVQAIIEAACELKKKGIDARPEIMIPLIGNVKEYIPLDKRAREISNNIIKKYGVELHYLVGTMIEIPRACLVADKIAEYAEFFSFGTNDLTQMGCGFSRDDAGKFLKEYVDRGIYEKDPFQVLDQEGIGQLVEMGVKRGRKANEHLEIGICGEHGGEPTSVEFCHKVGLDYVSCSPYRVPIARLASAQAVIKEK
ncbi:MAG: pyruvate, phosphate dikinase [Candidatus Cloacimonadota bacterium]|nr:MAG: pyruvate, phosphate dikinase [Candidatus Cloacimonadota bacterium]